MTTRPGSDYDDAHIIAALVAARAAGDEDGVNRAAGQLVELHADYIWRLHAIYCRRGEWPRELWDDYGQEMLERAFRQARRFDPEKTPATHAAVARWLRHGMQRARSNTGRQALRMSMSENDWDRLNWARKAADETDEFGELTDAALEAREQLGGFDVATGVASLDYEMGTGEGSATLADLLPDAGASPEDVALAGERGEVLVRLREAVRCLPARERDAVTRWMGMDGPRETLHSIGARRGVSREAARQALERGVAMLQHPITLSWILGYGGHPPVEQLELDLGAA